MPEWRGAVPADRGDAAVDRGVDVPDGRADGASFTTGRPGGRLVGRGIGAVLFGTPRRGGASVFTRTGNRSTNTHPTCGTGLPPIKRPCSNNHG